MTKSKRSRTSANGIAFAEVCLQLQLGNSTKDEIAKHVGIGINTLIKWMRYLEARKLIYICDYRRNSNCGQWAAVWAWGYDEKNVAKPVKLTQAQYSANSRLRKQQRQVGGFAYMASSLAKVNKT